MPVARRLLRRHQPQEPRHVGLAGEGRRDLRHGRDIGQAAGGDRMNHDMNTSAAAGKYIAADPYPWPYNGDLRPANTTLIVIDMQTDFCGKGGYVDRMG